MGHKIGIIGGTLFRRSGMFSNSKLETLETQFGICEFYRNENFFFIPRHGSSQNIPPHKINHHANMSGLKQLECDYVIGACSVGSLKKELTPGSILIPDDYINLRNQKTIFENSINHLTPELSSEVSQLLIASARECNAEVIVGGVYFQTAGPRLETKAEIRMLSNFADIVGMTMADEAIAAQELELKYGAICSIDNYGNGVGERTLTMEEILQYASQNGEIVRKIVLNLA